MINAGWGGPLIVTEIRARDKASFGDAGRPVILSEEIIAEGPNGVELRLVFAPHHGWTVGDELVLRVDHASLLQQQTLPEPEPLPDPPPKQSEQIPLIDLTD